MGCWEFYLLNCWITSNMPLLVIFQGYALFIHFGPICRLLQLSMIAFTCYQSTSTESNSTAWSRTKWQKASKLRAPPAIRTTQGKACLGVSCPPIILWNINYKSNSEGTSHTFLDNEKLPVWSEFFLRCRLTTTSLPAAHILKVRTPDVSPK